MEKIFKVAQVRDLLNQVHNEKISFSRMVEILNEQASGHITKIQAKSIDEKIKEDFPTIYQALQKSEELLKDIKK